MADEFGEHSAKQLSSPDGDEMLLCWTQGQVMELISGIPSGGRVIFVP